MSDETRVAAESATTVDEPVARATVQCAEVRTALKALRPLAYPKLVRVDLAPGEVVLTVTDGYGCVAHWTTPAGCAEVGTRWATLAGLNALVRGRGTVVFELAGAVLKVSREGRPTTSLPEPATGGVPVFGLPDGDGVVIPAALLADVLPAAATDQARPLLASVCIDGPNLTATNSYRLHRVTADGAGFTREPVIVPREIVAALVATAQPVRLVVEYGAPSVMLAEAGSLRVVAKCVDGDYPRVEQVIPADAPQALRFDTTAMVDALRSLCSVTQGSEPVRIEQVPEGLRLRVVAHDGTTADVTVPGSCSAPVELGAAPGYLADLLTGTTSGELRFTDGLKPFVLREPGEGFQRLRLQMPVRLS